MDAKSVDYENQNQSKNEKYMIKAQKLFKFESKSWFIVYFHFN